MHLLQQSVHPTFPNLKPGCLKKQQQQKNTDNSAGQKSGPTSKQRIKKACDEQELHSPSNTSQMLYILRTFRTAKMY